MSGWRVRGNIFLSRITTSGTPPKIKNSVKNSNSKNFSHSTKGLKFETCSCFPILTYWDITETVRKKLPKPPTQRANKDSKNIPYYTLHHKCDIGYYDFMNFCVMP